MILVSSCLLGLKCRYDGKVQVYPQVLNYLKDKEFLPVCPEQMGGLSTPRKPCEVTSIDPIRIQTEAHVDCTEAFLNGVNEVVKLITLKNISMALLKAKSPSCGSKTIYDGTFSGQLIPGQGVLAKQLQKIGIQVMDETDI